MALAAPPPRNADMVKRFQAITAINVAGAEQQIFVYFNRSAASPLHMGDVVVPGICFSVFLSIVLL